MADVKRGVLLVVSGPAGCGKGTVLAHVIQSGDYCYSVSATTRSPRPGEEDGVNYFFITKEEFEEKIQKGDMLEYTHYVGNYYGTPKDYVEGCLNSGKNVILEIETEGAMNVKRIYPEALLIFIAPPDVETLEARLRGRGTEDEETIQRRMAKALHELSLADRYDLCVVNIQGDPTIAANTILKVVEERQKAEK